MELEELQARLERHADARQVLSRLHPELHGGRGRRAAALEDRGEVRIHHERAVLRRLEEVERHRGSPGHRQLREPEAQFGRGRLPVKKLREEGLDEGGVGGRTAADSGDLRGMVVILLGAEQAAEHLLLRGRRQQLVGKELDLIGAGGMTEILYEPLALQVGAGVARALDGRRHAGGAVGDAEVYPVGVVSGLGRAAEGVLEDRLEEGRAGLHDLLYDADLAGGHIGEDELIAGAARDSERFPAEAVLHSDRAAGGEGGNAAQYAGAREPQVAVRPCRDALGADREGEFVDRAGGRDLGHAALGLGDVQVAVRSRSDRPRMV